MNREYSFQKVPRCTATSKRTREQCKAPAVQGWTICRFHGARAEERRRASATACIGMGSTRMKL
jgi:hypothetical protein